jgi:galactose mutarotase-like enzyme
MPLANYETLGDGVLQLTVDASSGGKIRSLRSLRTGTEYFYQDSRAGFLDVSYSDHDISGIDECFPTVMACQYPHGRWRSLHLGDHGLLWRRPWKVTRSETAITAAIELSSIPIRFERVCRLAGPGEVVLEYTIENRGNEPFEFLYAHHLMLAADHQTRIKYPAEMDSAYATVIQHVDGVEKGDWLDWPPPSYLDISEPFDPRRGSLIKLFSPELTTGRFSISHASNPESLHVEFDAAHLPYLGVLIAQGYNPLGRDREGLIIGVEPTTGIGDDLASCRETKTGRELKPGSPLRFQIKYALRPTA